MKTKKLGNPTGVAAWRNLETAGDVKRLLAWLIHSIRSQNLDPKTAAIMAQIGAYLLKAVETGDLEARLDALERGLASATSPKNCTT